MFEASFRATHYNLNGQNSSSSSAFARQHLESWIQLSFRDLQRRTEVLYLQGGF